jgi:hypothetical protein
MEKSGEYVIHSQRMAGWLTYCGHKLIKTADNRLRAGYRIFIFVDSDKLRKDMAEYVPVSNT